MANDIVIRKATKDYVCSCCGYIIRKGTEYLDKCIFNVGHIVKHDRYHDECPQTSIAVKLINKIEQAEGDLLAMDGEGNKIHIVGVAWNDDQLPLFIYREWNDTHKRTLLMSCIYNLVGADGEALV